MTQKKATTQPAKTDSDTTSKASTLLICRNKHWQYISSYHGPWLQLPIEILESLAHQNWIMPSPRLIDPAVFFDMLRIRKYVDDASHDSVRASIGISNTAMSGRMDYFGAGGGPGSQLSKERIFKIRQKAVNSLVKAYKVDEVAASVAVMQATSTLEDVALHVLKREPSNSAARYVHFFHEKIPSREIENHAATQPLTQIIDTFPWEEQAAPLRTRALIQLFNHHFNLVTADLTLALRIVAELKRIHQPQKQELEIASKMKAQQEEAWCRGSQDRSLPALNEEDYPQSLEQQLLFNRAGAYLSIAWSHVDSALNGLQDSQPTGDDDTSQGHQTRLEARKQVKTNAKRALKDYLAFLSHFEYTPGLPFEITNEIMNRVYELTNRTRSARLRADEEPYAVQTLSTLDKKEAWPAFSLPKIYPVSTLFAERLPADLPPFPKDDLNTSTRLLHEVLGSREAVTYHPLLAEALHSVLLAHALLQTSPTELQRHAHNVARLISIADGYPIFQLARSTASADWNDILVETKDWLSLASSWRKLCTPAPLPDAAGGWVKNVHQQQRAETPEQKQERIKHESILEALSDDRVVDEDSFQEAVRARLDRASQQKSVDDVLSLKKDKAADESKHIDHETFMLPQLLSQRARAVARWVLEAPASLRPKKRRPARKKKPVCDSDGLQSLANSISTLSVDNDEDVD